MDRLSNLTQADIKNGALTRMLAGAGIPDVSEYVKQFHTKTEHVLLQELESQDSYSVNSEERVITLIDVQSWIMSFRPCLNDSVQITSNEPQAKQPPLPSDVQSWITGLRLRLDDPIEPSVPKPKPEPYRPTDLNSWMQHMAPVHLHSDTPPSATAPIVPEHSSSAVAGDLTSWLTDWSKSLAELPPPASLDSWLQGLVPTNMHEPLNSSTTPKGRLNSYLNAAQKVLSEHGYQVDNNVKPAGLPPAKAGMFGNVKQMYFLWKTLDKNNDRKITVVDVQIMLQEMGLGFVSKFVAQALFDMVDSNHDGELQFRDFIALMGILKQLVGAVGSAKAKN